eukprot:m.19687 g.19687  ORF g.19687 m.19687 type:complete len:506 (-) comp7644_c0_seq1:698-2215(-)
MNPHQHPLTHTVFYTSCGACVRMIFSAACQSLLTRQGSGTPSASSDDHEPAAVACHSARRSPSFSVTCFFLSGEGEGVGPLAADTGDAAAAGAGEGDEAAAWAAAAVVCLGGEAALTAGTALLCFGGLAVLPGLLLAGPVAPLGDAAEGRLTTAGAGAAGVGSGAGAAASASSSSSCLATTAARVAIVTSSSKTSGLLAGSIAVGRETGARVAGSSGRKVSSTSSLSGRRKAPLDAVRGEDTCSARTTGVGSLPMRANDGALCWPLWLEEALTARSPLSSKRVSVAGRLRDVSSTSGVTETRSSPPTLPRSPTPLTLDRMAARRCLRAERSERSEPGVRFFASASRAAASAACCCWRSCSSRSACSTMACRRASRSAASCCRLRRRASACAFASSASRINFCSSSSIFFSASAARFSRCARSSSSARCCSRNFAASTQSSGTARSSASASLERMRPPPRKPPGPAARSSSSSEAPSWSASSMSSSAPSCSCPASPLASPFSSSWS